MTQQGSSTWYSWCVCCLVLLFGIPMLDGSWGIVELSMGKVQNCRSHWDNWCVCELQAEVPLQAPLVSKRVLDAWTVFPSRHFKGKASLKSLIQPFFGTAVPEGRKIHQDYFLEGEVQLSYQGKDCCRMCGSKCCSALLQRTLQRRELCRGLWQISARSLWLCALKVVLTSPWAAAWAGTGMQAAGGCSAAPPALDWAGSCILWEEGHFWDTKSVCSAFS